MTDGDQNSGHPTDRPVVPDATDSPDGSGDPGDDGPGRVPDPSPSVAGTTTVLAAGALALAGIAVSGRPEGLVFAVPGLVSLAVGVRRGSRRAATRGGLALFGGALLAGALGGRPAPLAVATAGLLTAWGAGSTAIDLADDLRAGVHTADELQARLAATTGVVALLGGALAVGIFRTTSGGLPVVTVLIAVLGAMLILLAIRNPVPS